MLGARGVVNEAPDAVAAAAPSPLMTEPSNVQKRRN